MAAYLLAYDDAFEMDDVPGGNNIERVYWRRGGNRYYYEKSYDFEGRIEIFTDGACLRNGQHGARGGCGVWFGMGHPCNDSFPLPAGHYLYFHNQTNNRAELQAACQGLRNAHNNGENRIRLFTDSLYVFNGLSKNIYKWEMNGWRTFNHAVVKNVDLWKKLRDLSLQFDECVIQWAPRTHPEMQEADRLAKDGANM